jgi:hypothetical protein
MSGQTSRSRSKTTARAAVVKRPTSIKVLAVTYTVTWLTEDEWYAHHLDQDAVGITERDSGVIWMRADPTSNEDSLRMTMLHEVLHTCTQASRFERYLKEVEDPEEFFIGQISPVLLQVLHDNPNLMGYLLKLG